MPHCSYCIFFCGTLWSRQTTRSVVLPAVVVVTLYAVPEVVTEGNSVQVCVMVTSLPEDGIECNVTVIGETVDGTASESHLE